MSNLLIRDIARLLDLERNDEAVYYVELSYDLNYSDCQVRKRIERRLGRLCARTALNQIGIRVSDLATGIRGMPVWPDGVTGSIAHTDNFSCAVVLKSNNWSLGIDAEQVAAVTPSTWPLIFSEDEIESLRCVRLAAESAVVLFTAKEAVFKALGHQQGYFVDFRRIRVRADAAHLSIALMEGESYPKVIRGTYFRTNGIAITVAAIDADS